MQTTNYTNLDFLREISDGNDIFYKEFISLFLTSAPKAISEMEKSYVAKDWESLRQLSHKIKPSFNYVGLKELNHCAAKIEDIATRKNDTAEIQMLLDNIKSVCAVAFKELEEEVKNGLLQ